MGYYLKPAAMETGLADEVLSMMVNLAVHAYCQQHGAFLPKDLHAEVSISGETVTITHKQKEAPSERYTFIELTD